MNITGTGYNQYKKINTQNKGKVNSSQQQSKDPGFKGDVFKSLEYVNRDLVKPKNKQNAAFKGLFLSKSKDITGEYIFLNNAEEVENIKSTKFVILKGMVKAKNIEGKTITLDNNASAHNIEGNIITLYDNASAHNIKGNSISLNNCNCVCDIDGNEKIFLKGDSCAHDIKAPQITLSNNAVVSQVNAEQLVNLSDKAVIDRDITMTSTDNSIVKIIGPNVTIGGGINFPEGSNGKVILVPDEKGQVANIDKNNVKNGVINVEGGFIKLTGSMEVNNVKIREAYLLNNVKAKKVEGYYITLQNNAHADEIISRSYVDLQQDATAGKITAKQVYLESFPSVNEVNAEKLVKLEFRAKVNGDIKLTGNQEPKVLLDPHSSVGGKIIFPENSNGKVFLTPFKDGLNTLYNKIDESKVENGILIKSKDPYPRLY